MLLGLGVSPNTFGGGGVYGDENVAAVERENQAQAQDDDGDDMEEEENQEQDDPDRISSVNTTGLDDDFYHDDMQG